MHIHVAVEEAGKRKGLIVFRVKQLLQAAIHVNAAVEEADHGEFLCFCFLFGG
jgi:hypothetical protein